MDSANMNTSDQFLDARDGINDFLENEGCRCEYFDEFQEWEILQL
jgi:hypothetical protein